MSESQKIRVAVLRGGPSSEYEVSLKTGDSVLKNLPEKYQGIDVFISLEGELHMNGRIISPKDLAKHADVAFVAMHGQYGEDGRIQELLESFGIPFTGSKALQSFITMNKHFAKQTLSKLGGKVKLAPHKIFTWNDIVSKGMHEIFREIQHPSVVKPLNAGSSVGVSIVRTYIELEGAITKALVHDDAVIIEEFIEGREATCGVVDGFRGEEHYALLPIEIVPPPTSAFFDYEAKYDGGSLEICPGNFNEATKLALQEMAKVAHKELGLRHYSRSDFIIHPKRGIYFLEANTLPGLTSESLLPKSLRAVGSSLSEFLDHVIGLARSQK